MTNQNFLSKLKSKITFILALICIISMSMFFLTACDDDETPTRPSYSYTEEDETQEVLIGNANFTYGTATKDSDDYPITSVNSWTKKYHNQAVGSSVDSGVIDISSDSWEELIKKLKEDAELINILSIKHGKTKDEIKNNLETYVTNPSKHPNAVDGKVYMLNNYSNNSSYIGWGTAQTITSSSALTLNKGEIAKISVYVKTQNLSAKGDPRNMGANIRLENRINGVSQGEFRISSIVADEWTEYNIYVLADKDYSCFE